MDRVEWKAKFMSRVFKNDHQLDIMEFYCLVGPYAETLAFNAVIESNCTYIRREISCHNRAMERIEDIIDTLPRLDESIITEEQELYFTDGLALFVQSLQKIAAQNPFPEVYEDIEYLGQKFCKTVSDMLGECIGTKERRMRVEYELEILAEMINAEKEHLKIKKMSCGK